MLKINFEIHPFGSQDEAYNIDELFIWNTGEEKDGYYKYRWCWYEKPDPELLPNGLAKAYPNHVWHRREKGSRALVRHVLEVDDF